MKTQDSPDAVENWSIDDWNSALYCHFFTILPGTSSTTHVVRLYVTSDELCAATNVRSCHVRSAFIAAIRRGIESRSLGSDAYQRYTVWDKESSEPPPFLSHLMLTCMVANDIVGDLKSIGDFRKRLSVLLEKSSHGLNRLRPLWEEFEKWSTRRNLEDPNCKRLVLPKIPTSGFHSIIGYSVRLAVPSLHDLKTLGILLRREKLIVQEPEVNAVLSVISQNMGKFTAQFQEAFQDFTSAYRSAPASVAFYTIFWSAIREVALSAVADQQTESHGKARLELEDDDGQFWLSITSDKEIAIPGIRPVKLLTPRRSTFRFILVAEQEAHGLTSKILSSQKLDKQLEKSFRAVRNAVSSGFLLFKRSEDGVYVLCDDFPAMGNLRALISESLLPSFRAASQGSANILDVSASIHDGWFELRGLTIEGLRRLDLSRYPSLLKIRCLKATLPPPEIMIRGGLHVGESFVAIAQALPYIEVADADNVSIEIQPNQWSSLDRIIGSANDWSFSPQIDPQLLLGSHRVVAFSNSFPIAEKKISFIEGLYSYEYKRPLDISRWFVDGSRCDITALAELSLDMTTQQEFEMATVRLSINDADAPPIPESQRTLSRALATILSCELSERRGITESSFVSLLTQNFGVELREVWSALRAFVEAGILDVMGDFRWRGRVYFGCPPKLVVFRRGNLYEAVLTGLIPPFLLDRFTQLSSSWGVTNVESTSCCPIVPALPRCRSTSVDTLTSFAQELNIAPPSFLRTPTALGTSVRSIIKPKVAEPKNWPTYRKWDWNTRSFVNQPIQLNCRNVSIEWCRRDDGPDCYKIVQDGSLLWWTRSRSWALLAAFTVAEVPVFEKSPNGVLESWGDSLYLPLSIARVVAVLSTQVPGPVRSSNGNWKYRYAFPDDRIRKSTLDMLWPENHCANALWSQHVFALMETCTGPVVPLPLILRRSLHAIAGNHPLLGSKLVPASALPALYALLGSITKEAR